MSVAHSTLTGDNLHEPKGIENASSGDVYIADGSGSGAWTAVGNVPSGMIADFATPVAPTGWLELDGTAVSTTTYSSLYNAMTIQQSGTRGTGTGIITGLSSTTNMKVGYYVFGTGIPSGTKISSVDSSTQITLDTNAVSSGTSTVVVSPWLLDTGTITLPDTKTSGRFRRSRTSSVEIGTTQADQNKSHTHTNTVGNQSANHTHSVSGNTGTESVNHTHDYTDTYINTGGGNLSGGGSFLTESDHTRTTGQASANHTHSFSVTSGANSANHNHTVTIDNEGGTEARPLAIVLMTCVKT